MSDYYGPGGASAAPSAPAAQQQGFDQGKIFVGGLSWQTTEESLQFHFEQFGPVKSVEVMRDRVTGDPRGFAFVVFHDAATVDVVMNEPNHEVNHKIVDVKRAQARGVAPPSIHRKDESNRAASAAQPAQQSDQSQSTEQVNNKVFVGGIPPSVDKQRLQQIFEEFGAVADCIVMVDQVTNRSRGFGFVTFENGTNGAQKAIAAQPLNIEGRHVEVKLATPKADQARRVQPAGSKHVGLRAGVSSSTSGEFAGLAVSYARNGWRAGYGSMVSSVSLSTCFSRG